MKRLFSLVIIVSVIFVLFPRPSVFAQASPNSIYLELLGNGGLYSVNYDRFFSENLGGRIGFMYLSEMNIIFSSLKDLLIIPIMLNYFIGSEHKLELGAGIIYVSVSGGEVFGFKNNKSSSAIGGTATIGYRYQQSDGGFLFRVGFTPYISPEGFGPYGGISIGTSF